MAFLIRGVSIAAAAFPLLLFCSCDKHHLGELPEVQKEHIDLAAKAREPAERSLSPSEDKQTPTPAEFFPPKKTP